ncbi:MAG TPA: hypothetical protein VFL69_07865 [Marmoricola sp.]|nr:hypothetical protein [Marmoricola sp.]
MGLAAGAAGTTALNAATYLDMAVRARPSSSTPQQMVEKGAEALGVEIPGEGEERENRVAGLGPLAGIATGLGVGLVYGMLDTVRLRPPRTLGALLAGGAAMAGSVVPMAATGITDPKTWDAATWASDVVPHLAYGVVVAWTMEAAHKV